MPATAVLARQKYRHVDFIQFMNYQEINSFISFWSGQGMVQQRVGFLYGYYCEDPHYPDAIRAVVEAIYEPPQVGDASGFRLLADPNQRALDRVTEALGLERIGWIFTSLPREEALTSAEVRMCAQWQNLQTVEHPTGYPVSKFVTVVAKQAADGNIAPAAFMVSDQCQALERDEVLGDSDSHTVMTLRKADKSDLLPTIMEKGRPTEAFDPNWFIVNVTTLVPTRPRPLFKHSDFPRENRPTKPRSSDVRAMLNKYRAEPFTDRISDFHLLLYLANLLDVDTACVLADAVQANKPIDATLQELLQEIQ
eukprot:GILI01014484.1.p1 GENE.GILI01014484.1~~GILI01014484.1.p1  ORF type:complete len:309 (+),score=91.53 GILI01014484.1:602-1528(+)